MEKFKLVLDSSQIACFLECPQKWEYYYNKRLRPSSYIQDEAMNAGTYGHKLLEIYYRMRARNCSKDAILNALDKYRPDNDICECGCSQEFHVELPALEVQECQKCKRCMKFRPREFTLATVQRNKVRTTVRMYIEKYNLEGDIIPTSEHAVEVGFSECFYEDSENKFLIEGRFDIVGKLQGLECIADHKFQSRAYWLYNRGIQFKNYILASGLNTLIVNYIRLHDNKTAESFSREVVSMNSLEREAWRRRLTQIYMRIKKQVLSKEFNHNWNECGGHTFTNDKEKIRVCFYTHLCEELDPQVAANKERILYKIDEQIWRPW